VGVLEFCALRVTACFFAVIFFSNEAASQKVEPRSQPTGPAVASQSPSDQRKPAKNVFTESDTGGVPRLGKQVDIQAKIAMLDQKERDMSAQATELDEASKKQKSQVDALTAGFVARTNKAAHCKVKMEAAASFKAQNRSAKATATLKAEADECQRELYDDVDQYLAQAQEYRLKLDNAVKEAKDDAEARRIILEGIVYDREMYRAMLKIAVD
jgi:hypothetical protein